MAKLGIDFGTTNSVAVAYDKEQHKFTYFNFKGNTPVSMSSTIEFHDGYSIIGNEARKRMSSFADIEGYHYERSIKSKISSGENIYVFGEKKEPHDLISLILQKLKEQAVDKSNGAIEYSNLEAAVFTIPINFNGKARRIIRAGANDAGLEVISFIHEPFAAIIGDLFTDEIYTTNEEALEQITNLDGENILVFDYGGGTLDITVVEFKDGDMREIGTAELTNLAGDKFDELIAKYVWNIFAIKYSHKYSLERLESVRKAKWGRLLSIAEECKIELSTKESTEFLLTFVIENTEDIEVTITRKDFELIISDVIEAACNKIDEALAIANKKPEDIGRVLLSGGTCNIPIIEKRMIDKFGCKVKKAKNSALVIAQGAAVIAEMGWFPSLAKDIRILLSDDSYWSLFNAGTVITKDDESKNECVENFVCVDSRQKIAKIIIDEGEKQESGKILSIMKVPILGDHRFGDEIEVCASIDRNIVLTVKAHSLMVNDYDVNYSIEKTAEIYKLCFGLKTERGNNSNE